MISIIQPLGLGGHRETFSVSSQEFWVDLKGTVDIVS